MAYKSIEKTDNFQTVVFDPSPTAPDMQALYEKGWVLHMGPFPVNRGFSALFFREKRPVNSLALSAEKQAVIVFNHETELYSVRATDTDEVVSHSWATWEAALESAKSTGYVVQPGGGAGS